LGVSVIKSTGKAERLEAGVAVLDDFAPHIIVHLLDDGVGGDVDDEPGAAEVVFDDAVGVSAFDHEVGDVGAGGVDEAALDVAVAVEFGDGFELVLVQEGLFQDVVALFADAAVLAINEVVDVRIWLKITSRNHYF
jgi:hypothetical protein